MATAAVSSTTHAQEWHYSSWADVVEVIGQGAFISTLSTVGSGPEDPGWANATTDKNVSYKVGASYHARLECTETMYGGGLRVVVVSPWRSAEDKRYSTSATCPPEAPYADWYTAKVQVASRVARFNCQFNDADFGDKFVGCSE
jgi:hypothetical protein